MSFPLLSRRDLSVGTGATTAAVLTRPTFATVDRSDIVDLRTDGLVAPIGVENRGPRLSWRMDSRHFQRRHQHTRTDSILRSAASFSILLATLPIPTAQ